MKKKVIFEGSAIAIITPFTEDLKKIDFETFGKIIEDQIDRGTDAIIFSV